MSDVDQTTEIEQPVAPDPARNPLVLALAVVAALAVGAAVWFFAVTPLLLGDDAGSSASPPDQDAAAPDDTVPQAPADPDLEDEVTAEDLPLVTYEVFLARDPFEPVVPEPTEEATDIDAGQTEADDGADSGPDGTGTDPSDPNDADGTLIDPTDPTDPGGGTQTPTPVPPPSAGNEDPVDGCRAGDEPVCDGRVVSVVDIDQDDRGLVALVQLDATIYEVREGDVFGGNFLVQSITEERVTLVFGDDVLNLREGDRVLK